MPIDGFHNAKCRFIRPVAQDMIFGILALAMASAVLLNPGCAQPPPPASTTKSPAQANTFHTGLMYWAGPRGILDRDWYLVVAGTVVQTEAKSDPNSTMPAWVDGRLKVERILFVAPQAVSVVPTNLEYFESEGFDGLKPGDKVIVFVNQYDTSDGIIPMLGSNCRIGIKVDDWKDPIVSLVQETAPYLNGESLSQLRKYLQVKDHAQQWHRFDKEVVDAILSGSYERLMATRSKNASTNPGPQPN
jgi:hypothetical protein